MKRSSKCCWMRWLIDNQSINQSNRTTFIMLCVSADGEPNPSLIRTGSSWRQEISEHLFETQHSDIDVSSCSLCSQRTLVANGYFMFALKYAINNVKYLLCWSGWLFVHESGFFILGSIQVNPVVHALWQEIRNVWTVHVSQFADSFADTLQLIGKNIS